MSSLLNEYLSNPSIPKSGNIKLSGPAIKKYFQESSFWLYAPPFATLRSLSESEDWDPERINELSVDYDLNYLVGDFGMAQRKGF